MKGECIRAALPRRRQGVERHGAAQVADEAKGRHRRRDHRARVRDRGVGNAQERRLGTPTGFESLLAAGQLGRQAGVLRGGRDRPPGSSRADKCQPR